MPEVSPDRLLPFSEKCPFCKRVVQGQVRAWMCLDGGSPYADKVTGLIMDTCEHCGRSIGFIMKAGKGKAVVLETGEGAKMQLRMIAGVIAKKEQKSTPRSRSRLRRFIQSLFSRSNN